MIRKITFLILFGISLSACQQNASKESRYALLVTQNNVLVQEDYFNGAGADDFMDVQSLTKGIMSILIGIAIEKGFIASENDAIEKYLSEEFKTLDDAQKKKISIKHLLNQTSGLAWKGYLEHEDWLASADPILHVLQKEMVAAPGSEYNYNSGATHLLSVIITRATGISTLDFAKEYLFQDIGIEKVEWEKRNKGYYDGSGLGLRMKARDLMTIGQLLLAKGMAVQFYNKQVVNPLWIEKMFDPQEKSASQWGLRNSKHGFCWYQANLDGLSINYGMGYGGQFIFMIPAQKLVIVATHNHDTPRGLKQQKDFLKNMLPVLIKKYKEK